MCGKYNITITMPYSCFGWKNLNTVKYCHKLLKMKKNILFSKNVIECSFTSPKTGVFNQNYFEILFKIRSVKLQGR